MTAGRSQSASVVVIGGGIAGVSAAFYLSQHTDVVLVEAEKTLAYHTTGRSAAQFFENYGAPSMRVLARLSRPFFEAPPDGLADSPLLLAPTGALIVGRAEQRHLVEQEATAGRAINSEIRLIDATEATEMVPALRPEHAATAVWDPSAAELDVAAIHLAFVRGMRRNGGQILTTSRVTGLEHRSGRWLVQAGDVTLRAGSVVNAAGAWGDHIAQLAGIRPMGLQPRRRTVFMTPGSAGARRWPMVVNVSHEYYFKPDGEQMLCSLADATPSEPCDARPVDLDIAQAIERINEATTLEIRTVRSSWAGLRTFAPDEELVIGFDPDHAGFFWLVGQGGTGIQTSPAAGELASQLVLGNVGAASEQGFDLEGLGPGRFRTS